MGKGMKLKSKKRMKKVLRILHKDNNTSLGYLKAKTRIEKPKKKEREVIFEEPIKIRPSEKDIYRDPDITFRLDHRMCISYADFNRKVADMQYLGKKKQDQLGIICYPMTPDAPDAYEILFRDISYIVLEVFSQIEFPSLGAIKNPFTKKSARERAIIPVGSDFDMEPRHIQENDISIIQADEFRYSKSLKGYRIKRRVYERLLECFIHTYTPVFRSQDGDKERGVRIPLLSAESEPHDLFYYVLCGFVVLKNGKIFPFGN